MGGEKGPNYLLRRYLDPLGFGRLRGWLTTKESRRLIEVVKKGPAALRLGASHTDARPQTSARGRGDLAQLVAPPTSILRTAPVTRPFLSV